MNLGNNITCNLQNKVNKFREINQGKKIENFGFFLIIIPGEIYLFITSQQLTLGDGKIPRCQHCNYRKFHKDLNESKHGVSGKD